MSARALKEKTVAILLRVSAATAILLVALIFLFLIREGLPFIREPGLSELAGKRWNPVSFQKESFGILPLISGSLLVTLLATILALPFGVGGAVYIAEMARPREREILKPFIELLAGIPSVVLGFFGLVVLAPLVKNALGLSTGQTALTGAIMLALMAIPTIISVSEDAVRAVPVSYKAASLALGASRLQTLLRVTIPAARSGILAAVMLGMGRVIGETMAVLMVTGNAPVITLAPVESVRTMTATIAAEMGEVAFGSAHYQALFWIGLALLLATLTLTWAAQRALRAEGRSQ